MNRIAVISVTKTQAGEIAARVRGAEIEAVPIETELAPLLAAGKAVLLSAELGLSDERLRELSTHDRAKIAVVNPYRHLPSRALIGQHLAAGKLGAPGLIRLHRWSCAPLSGALWCDLDLLGWYFGLAPNLVFALDADVGLQVHCGFPGGMALLDHARHAAQGDDYCSLTLIGSAGAAYADDHQNMQLHFAGGSPHAVRTDEGIAAWAAIVQDFIAAKEPRSETTVLHWQWVAAWVAAVRESLHSGQAVRPQGQV